MGVELWEVVYVRTEEGKEEVLMKEGDEAGRGILLPLYAQRDRQLVQLRKSIFCLTETQKRAQNHYKV